MSGTEDTLVLAGVGALAEDARFPLFVEELCALLGVSVEILSLEGERVAGWGEAAGKPNEFPLSTWGRGVGYVRVRGAAEKGPSPRDTARIVAMVAEGVLDSEYQLGSLAGEISEKYEEVNLLYELTDELSALFDEDRIGGALLTRLESTLSFQHGTVLLFDDARWRALATRIPAHEEVGGGGAGRGRDAEERKGTNLLAELAERRRPMIVTEESDDDATYLVRKEERPSDSVLAVPLLRAAGRDEESLIGAIVLRKRDTKPFTSGDEKLVSAVASQASTAIANARLVMELKEAARLKRDLELAREIQRSLLPDDAPVVEGAELAGRCVTTDNVGGDYYGYVVDEGRTVSVLLGDVTGHDLGAALIMTTARAMLLASASDSDNPGVVLERANRLLYRDLTASSLLISLFAARFDLESRRLLFANGGHNAPLLCRAETDSVEALDAEGIILGVQPDGEYEVGTRELSPGDAVVFYTDGIVEARSPGGEVFGEERLGEALVALRERSAREIVDGLYETVDRFVDGARVKDDITLVVLKAT